MGRLRLNLDSIMPGRSPIQEARKTIVEDVIEIPSEIKREETKVIIEEPVHKTSMAPEGKISLNSPKTEIHQLLIKHRKDEFFKAILEIYTWEEVLLALSNVCTDIAIKFRQRGISKKEDYWLRKAHYFHDAMISDEMSKLPERER